MTTQPTKSKRKPVRPTPNPCDLLAWYDRHRRDLPWRARPGEAADPYAVWISEIMLQQTTAAAVGPYFTAFMVRFPDVATLAAANDADVMAAWAGLGYYSRARNLLKAARTVVEDHGGVLPDTEDGLRALPGIGPYTSAAIAAIAFDRPATPVDGNIERVISRLFEIETPLPDAKPEIKAKATTLTPDDRPGDFAQAMMDLGATICSPTRPACGVCPWMSSCKARRSGIAETLPRKRPKPDKPVRCGTAFVAVRADGAVLLSTRLPKGLLGGMTEVPSSDWVTGDDMPRAKPPISAVWKPVAGEVTHVFTHFRLRLAVQKGHLPIAALPPKGMRFVAESDLPSEALPTVMRKVLAHAGISVMRGPGRPRKRAASQS
ncbi:MAG: A/G-specific adenine glycosylase [Pseudomonadota bacterium]